MKRYAKSNMQSFYPNCPADLQDECVVEISAEQLIVKYVHKGKLVEYIGVAEGEGHYLIKGRGFEAEATLHHNGGRILEGSWKQDQQYGMWRIYLDSED